MLIFHVVDERDARAWQSGLYYGNGRPKTSLAAVRAAALAAQAGTLAAVRPGEDDVRTSTTSRSAARPRRDPACSQTGFSCSLPCSYQLHDPRRDDG